MKEQTKNGRTNVALSKSPAVKDEGLSVLEFVLTGEKTWTYHFTSQRKQG
jgi:hypothetical protein